jgi:phosphoribosylanthranilate isomerase
LVGVFVNEASEKVRQAVESVGLTRIQLHGDEDAEFCEGMLRPVWKAIHLQELHDIAAMKKYKKSVECFLVDTRTAQARGGTGIVGDWNLAAKASKTYPVILAGGLNPENVVQAIAQVKPVGVDVSSGVESRPGKKDSEKLRRYFANLKKGS